MSTIGGFSSLPTISSQVPVGLAEAESLARQKKDNTIAAKADSQQPLNTLPNQRIVDTSGTTAKTRMDAGSSAETDAQAQQKFDSVINQLKARDREVRAHEQAHLAVAGQYARGMSFSYQTGPDGKSYAIGGEVGIDSSPVADDPEATIQKAMIVQSAAMAPAQPSSQDFRVAASARQMMAQAQAELASQDATKGQSESQASQESGESTESENAAANDESMENRQGVNRLYERAAFETRMEIPTGQEMVADLVNPA